MACPWGPALWLALFGQALGLHGLLQEAVWPALFGQALWPALFGQALWPAPGGRRCGLPLGAGVVACARADDTCQFLCEKNTHARTRRHARTRIKTL